MRRVLVSVLAVAALFSLAACGDDDKDEATTATTVAVATSSTLKPFSGDGSVEFCGIARANITSVQQALVGFVSNPVDGRRLLESVAPAVRETAAKAPSEIKPAVTVLADGFEELLKVLAAGEQDYSSVNTPEFAAARADLERYGRQVCGITG